MRVIGGMVRGRRLAEFEGEKIRPTADRVREALFSMLYSRTGPMQGKKILDVFAGSGALGIEALSRGAAAAWFIDNSGQAVQTIRENLDQCGFTAQAHILRGDARTILSALSGENPFDLIFMDPPYGRDLATDLLAVIDSLDLLTHPGVLCLETGINDPVAAQVGNLQRSVQRRYGSTMLNLFQRTTHD